MLIPNENKIKPQYFDYFSGECEHVYKTTGHRSSKHRRKLKCCLGSLLTAPVVLICQFCLVIVQQPL